MQSKQPKDFNKMLNNSKDMPKIIEISDEKSIQKYGGNRMLIAPPIFYDEAIKLIPKGKLATISTLRKYLAKKSNADFTDPMTSGIFVQIVALASHQRTGDPTPYHRVLKSDGELNAKYPEAFNLQKDLLRKEGFNIIEKGSKTKKYYVENYEDYLFEF